MKIQVNFYDKTTGATSPMDTINVDADYTPEEYIEDCIANDTDGIYTEEYFSNFEVTFERIEEE